MALSVNFLGIACQQCGAGNTACYLGEASGSPAINRRVNQRVI